MSDKRTAHGHALTRAVTLCVRCEVERYRYPGKLCGTCWREINGIVAVELPPEPKPEPPTPKVKAAPKPRVNRKRYPKDKDAERTRYRRRVLKCGPLPREQVDALWEARMEVPKPVVVRGCAWPGCDRPHAMHGYCYRDVRRVAKMGAEGAPPETLPARWEAHMQFVGDVFAANGAARRGRGTREKRPPLVLPDSVAAK